MFKRYICAYFLFLLMGSMAWAQGLHLSLANGEYYVGEPLQMSLSATGKKLETVSMTFEPALSVSVLGHRSAISVVNGRRSETSGLVLSATPEQAGTYKLIELAATTATGETLTSKQNVTFTVRALEQDPAVSIQTEVSSSHLYVGDTYTVSYIVRVPALKVPQGYEAPFLQENFFGSLERIRPAVRVPALPEVKVIDQSESDRLDGAIYEYRYDLTIVAEQAGTVTFPGAILTRQPRAIEVKNNQVHVKDSYAVGEALDIAILEPSTEGRPLHWTGAIARNFRLRTMVDALNVTVGDPVKLTIDILTDADEKMLRSMGLPNVDGIAFLPNPERSSLAEGGCRFVYTFRPTKAGLVTLPEIPFAFFHREKETYETVMTPEIPLRVAPLEKLFYAFGEGAQLTDNFPVPLGVTQGEQPRTQLSPWSLWMLLAAIVSVCIVLLKGVLLRVLAMMSAPIRWIAPRVWLRIKLQTARSPEEALVLVRQWLKRPSLTPDDIERASTTPEALEVAQAMRELEAARYTSNVVQWKDARKSLLTHLGRLKRFFVLALCLMTVSLFATPSNYQWQQANVITTRCETDDDFRIATNHWLGLIHTGDWSKETLLNASSTAFLAAEPNLSKQILRHYEELYGRDEASQQMDVAIAAYQGHPIEPFTIRRYSYGGRCDTAVVLLSLLIFSFALRLKAKNGRRLLRVLRVLLFIALFIVGMSLFETYRWRASSPLPQTLPTVMTPAEGDVQ